MVKQRIKIESVDSKLLKEVEEDMAVKVRYKNGYYRIGKERFRTVGGALDYLRSLGVPEIEIRRNLKKIDRLEDIGEGEVIVKWSSEPSKYKYFEL
jgi:hypothetical protein